MPIRRAQKLSMLFWSALLILFFAINFSSKNPKSSNDGDAEVDAPVAPVSLEVEASEHVVPEILEKQVAETVATPALDPQAHTLVAPAVLEEPQRSAPIAMAALEVSAPASAALNDTLWLDVRTPGEYASDHLAEAINLPLDEIQNSLPALEPNHSRVLALYCRSGHRSNHALSIAKNLGYTAAFNAGAYTEIIRRR